MIRKTRKSCRGFSRLIWHLVISVAAASTVVSFLPLSVTPASFRSTAKADNTLVSTSTREGRMAVFDDAWAAINEHYYDRSFHSITGGISWNAQRTVFRALAARTTSAQELYSVLRRMVASLNDPHTRVFTPGEKFDWWRPRFVTIGLSIKDIAGLPTVVRVEPGSSPHRAGVVVGDVIETINGRPALILAQRRLNDDVVNGPQARSRVFGTLLDGPPYSVVTLGWRRKDGEKRTAEFQRYWLERELSLRVRKNAGVAVIELDGFTRETARKLFSALKELKDVRGIILDLRNNGGGDAEAMTDVASTVLGPGRGLGRFVDRSGKEITLATRDRSPLIPIRLTRINLPLVVLSSERTSSAAEILIAELKASRRATIIGTQTCGCVLAIRNRHQLPDGGLLDISEFDYQTSSGERLEKNGVRPDESVSVERADLYSGRDRAMELAMQRVKALRTIRQTVSLKPRTGFPALPKRTNDAAN